MKAIFVGSQDNVNKVYPENIKAKMQELDFCTDKIYTKEDILSSAPFNDVKFIFSTWGMAELDKKQIMHFFPNLEAVFYAAGTVQSFARPFLECGIKVFSAWAANAVPVAEFTTAQIVLANKGYFINSSLYTSGNYYKARKTFEIMPGNYDCKVGLLGAGMIGTMVAERLKSFSVDVLVFDPFLSDEKAAALGVTKATLETVFSECQTISNHLANNEQTVNMVKRDLLDKMLPNATLINSGRGAQISEPDLIDFLKDRPDCSAVLDVTCEEPLPENHELYKLDNVFLTTHIAGSSGNEIHRMAEFMYTEYLNYTNGNKTNYEVTLKMLSTMA